MDQCKVCRDPGEWVTRVEHTEKKLDANCQAVEKLRAEIKGVSKMETHMFYIRQELQDFKEDRKDIKKFMLENYVTLGRFKWVERTLLALTAAGILWALNLFKIAT